MKNALSMYWRFCFLLLGLLITTEAVSQNKPSEKKPEIKELDEVLISNNACSKKQKRRIVEC